MAEGEDLIKLARNVVLGLLGAIGVLVVALFAVNLKDEDPDPAARAVIEGSDIPRAGDRNGFAIAVGLLAPEGQSPQAWGQKTIDAMVARDRAGPGQAPLPKEDALKFDFAAWMKRAPCEPRERDCFGAEQPATSTGALQGWLEGTRPLGERCEALLAADSWAETYVPLHIQSELLMIAQQQAVCQQAQFVRAALDQREGRGAEALRRVLALVAFERRVLAGSTTLIGKLVASARLARTTLFLSDLLRREAALLAGSADALARALQPMTPPERTLAPAFRAEFRLAATTFGDLAAGRLKADTMSGGEIPAVERWLMGSPLLRANATLNRVWPVFRGLIEIDAAAGTEFDAASARHRAVVASLEQPGADWIYNPVGKYLAAIGGPRLDDYILRVREADALLRLVALQAAVPAGADADAIRKLAADPAYRHPSSGTGMEYDPAARTLGYPIRGDRTMPEWIERVAAPRFFKAGRVAFALP